MKKGITERDEWKLRESLCQFCLEVLKAVDDSDPRKESAIEEYTHQLAAIQKRIAEIEAGVVVGLKPAVLSAKPLS